MSSAILLDMLRNYFNHFQMLKTIHQYYNHDTLDPPMYQCYLLTALSGSVHITQPYKFLHQKETVASISKCYMIPSIYNKHMGIMHTNSKR